MSEPESNGTTAFPTSECVNLRPMRSRLNRRRFVGASAAALSLSAAGSRLGSFHPGASARICPPRPPPAHHRPQRPLTPARCPWRRRRRLSASLRWSRTSVRSTSAHRRTAVNCEWRCRPAPMAFQPGRLPPGFSDHGQLPRSAGLDRRGHDGATPVAGRILELHAGQRCRSPSSFARACAGTTTRPSPLRTSFFRFTSTATTSTARCATFSQAWIPPRCGTSARSSSASGSRMATSSPTPPASSFSSGRSTSTTGIPTQSDSKRSTATTGNGTIRSAPVPGSSASGRTTRLSPSAATTCTGRRRPISKRSRCASLRSPAERIAGWVNGDIDLLWPLKAVDLPTVITTPGTLYVADAPSVMFAAFNFDNPARANRRLLHDIDLRRALSASPSTGERYTQRDFRRVHLLPAGGHGCAAVG